MKTIYKDPFGSYSITEHANGAATLRCRNCISNTLDYNKTYNNVRGARIALAKYCGGMPSQIDEKRGIKV